MGITKKRIKKIEKRLNVNKDNREIFFFGWDEGIDKKLEDTFIQKKIEEIKKNPDYNSSVNFIFLNKKEIESHKLKV